MPTNGEKQPRWLMGCKCGARVKASGDAGRDDRFLGRSEAAGQHLSVKSVKWAPWGGNPSPIRQDCRGTIEVCSKGDILTSGEDPRRSPPRVNSIRRSKALERRN